MYRPQWKCYSQHVEARKYPVYIEGKKYHAAISDYRCGRTVTFRRFFTKYEIQVLPEECGSDREDLLRAVRTAREKLCAKLERGRHEATKRNAELMKLAEWDGKSTESTERSDERSEER